MEEPLWFLPSDFLFCGDIAALAWVGEKKKPPERPPPTWRAPPPRQPPWGEGCRASAVPRGHMRHFLDKAQMWGPVRGPASPATSLPFSQPLNTCPRARKGQTDWKFPPPGRPWAKGGWLCAGSDARAPGPTAGPRRSAARSSGSSRVQPAARSWCPGRDLHCQPLPRQQDSGQHQTHLFDSGPVLQDVDLLQHVHDVRACDVCQGSRKPSGGGR